MSEPKRIRAFRLSLAKQIPKFPNNRASLQALQAKPLGELLIHYANWAVRYVAPRPRAVVVEPSALGDPRWNSLASNIEPLLTKVRQGDDLTPHLSLQPRTRGFTPGASGTGPGVDRWADKDILLNVMGYHHLHFDALLHNQIRSDDVLFAHITRDTFTAVGVFDHTVFEPPDPARPMTKERNRLWKIFSERTTRGAPVGATVLQSMIATSGHPVQLVQDSAQYAGTIARIDPQLDDANYVQGLYRQAGLPAPTKPKLRWHMKFLDLGLLDEAMGAFFVLKKGRT